MKNINKWVVGVVVLIVVFIGFSYLGGNEPAEGDPIKIGSIFSLTSFGADWGENNLRGAELAVQEINSSGGVLGRPLELINEDDGSDLKNSLSAYRKLTLIDNVSFVLSGWTENVEPFIPLLEDDGVISITVSAGANDFASRSSNLYRTWPQDLFAIKGLVEYAQKNDIKTVAIARSQATWEDGLYEGFASEAKKHGIEIVSESVYQRGERDFRTEIIKLKNSKPDALVNITDIQANVVLLKQLDEAGLDVPYLHPTDINLPAYIDNVPVTALERVVYAVPEGADEDFISKFETEYGVKPGPAADKAYDAVYMLAQAIKKAGTTDVEIVKESFKPFNGASGRIEFNENGDREEVSIWIMEWKEGGFKRI